MFMHAQAAGCAASFFQEMDTSIMTTTSSSDKLDPFSQAKIDLWHAASLELSLGPEADDPFVQAARPRDPRMAQRRGRHARTTPGSIRSSAWLSWTAASL